MKQCSVSYLMQLFVYLREHITEKKNIQINYDIT